MNSTHSLHEPVAPLAATHAGLKSPLSQTDFYRQVYCLMGLPIDAVSFAAACEQIRYSAINKIRCLLCTPNLNILIACINDPEFRDTVVQSDLLIADGMPLVWMSRLIGIPIHERVSGSNLIASLKQDPGPAISLYFFGGDKNVARVASDKLGQSDRGLRSAGYFEPGFGSLETISNAAVFDKINYSNADILSVAIGAQRGHTWLTRNRDSLVPPVIANLGATINFTAGTVRRAPVWMQKTGLEWLWRIKEEPALWRRYSSDGMTMLSLFFKNVLPCAISARYKPSPEEKRNTTHWLVQENGQITIELAGCWTTDVLTPLRASLANMSRPDQSVLPVSLNFKKVTHVDSGMLGLLLLLYGHQQRHGQPLQLHGVTKPVEKIFRHYHVDYLLAKKG